MDRSKHQFICNEAGQKVFAVIPIEDYRKILGAPNVGIIIPTIGESVKNSRILSRITQEELSEKSGVSVATISKLENGQNEELRQYTLERIANALGDNAERLKPKKDVVELRSAAVNYINDIFTSQPFLAVEMHEALKSGDQQRHFEILDFMKMCNWKSNVLPEEYNDLKKRNPDDWSLWTKLRGNDRKSAIEILKRMMGFI